MHKAKSIFILALLGIILFQGYINEFCFTHPFGHKHHHHVAGKLSLCEFRRQYKGTAYWPPMDCKHLNIQTDNFQQTQKEQIKPNIQTLALAVVYFELIKISVPKQHFQLLPEPKCRSATIISINTLRGPPLV